MGYIELPGASPVLLLACDLCERQNVKKPKKKRPADPIMRAHSVMQDVIALSEKPAKKPRRGKK